MKELALDHRGYMVKGIVMARLSEEKVIKPVIMQPFFIPGEKLTHGAIKRNINAGQYHCLGIESAELHIYDRYGDEYEQYNRTICLDYLQCTDAFC